MKLALSTLLISIGLADYASAASINHVLDFDVELDPQNHYYPIQDGYGGLTRWGFTAMPRSFLEGRGFSGFNGSGAAFSQWGSTGVGSANPFDFHSAILGAYSWDSATTKLSVVGFREGARIYERSLYLRPSAQQVYFSWYGVDAVGFYGGDDIILDGMNITVDMTVAPIPVPAALPMFGAALAGLGAFSAYRRRKAETIGSTQSLPT